MNAPVDARGVTLTEGAFVCYTTNDRGAGLSFGHIKQIKTKPESRSQWNPVTRQYDTVQTFFSHRIRVSITDVNGSPKFETRWDPEYPNPNAYDGTGKGLHVETDVQCVSGLIEHSEQKFLIL